MIEPGVYNVFIDLKPGAWTLVLNGQPVQAKYDPNDKVNLYGAYNYDAKFDVVRAPMQIAGVECARNPTPERGQHTDEVLAEFGFTADEIAALHAAKAV